MSQQLFTLGTDKLARLHAEAAERRRANVERRPMLASALRWLADRLDVA